MNIVQFIEDRLAEDQAIAEKATGRDPQWWETGPGYPEAPEVRVVNDRDDLIVPEVGELEALHIARHDPARVLAEVAAKRRIVELHTTGSYRTYQCGNSDHIQEWQCERAKEPYSESRYCEVCGGSECDETPLLAAIWSNHPDFDPAWGTE